MNSWTKAGFVYAHPDDESFLSAALIRQIADCGGRPVLLVATRGDAGQKNGDYGHVSKAELAAIRDREMAEAAKLLGLENVVQLGYPDGRLNEAGDELVAAVERFLREHKVEAVFTFPPDGGNGHPDHIAISRAATAAATGGRCPNVRFLYYSWFPAMDSDGKKPDLAVETEPYWAVKAAALRAHDSQKYAIERYFGSLDRIREDRRHEKFVLGWQAAESEKEKRKA
jgi:LmbE family N-acetylglucosaminyl deacetylase